MYVTAKYSSSTQDEYFKKLNSGGLTAPSAAMSQIGELMFKIFNICSCGTPNFSNILITNYTKITNEQVGKAPTK